MTGILGFLSKGFNLNIGSFSVPIPYWQALAIVFLLFVLILTMADFRKHYIHWSFKGGLVGVLFGFILALILEGFLLVEGRTVLTGLLGWKNAPAPISHILDAGREQFKTIICTN